MSLHGAEGTLQVGLRPLGWGGPWIPRGAQRHPRVLIRGKREGQRQRETGEAALLAVRMQEGPRARDAAPLEAGKGGNRCSPGASGRTSPAHAWILGLLTSRM